MDLNVTTLSRKSVQSINVTMMPSVQHIEKIAAFAKMDWTEDGCVVYKDYDPLNNPNNIITKQTEFWISMICAGGLIPLLFVVGVPGNILSAAVFYRQGLKERINLCIFWLAIVDLLVITVTFLLCAEQVSRSFNGYFSFFIRYFVGLTGFTWVSMFLIAIIATERCFCVVSPLRAQRVLSTRTMAVFITITSVLLLTGMLVIAGHKHTVVCLFDSKTNTTPPMVYVTEFYKRNKKILDILDVFVYSTGLPAIFLTIITVTTSITSIKLCSARRWRKMLSSVTQATHCKNQENQKDHEKALTKMLIATSVLFMVCLSPMLVVQIIMFVVPELHYGHKYHNFTAASWSIIPVFRCVNSSLNFFVYFRMGSRFRETLRQILPCKKT